MTEQLSPNDSTALEAAVITHLEIPALVGKEKETTEFYKAIFGWHIVWDMMPNYGMTTNTQGKTSIGLPLVDQVNAAGNFYVHVSSIEDVLQKVKNLGGKVLAEKNMISENIGFGASIEDLSGNKIGLFCPE
ncbi:MAG: VOC family protein [Candidatus Kariarchaeaceae archaeon]|jgi:predicted enzyme related to lactoylglutathione lyase